ncbi:MAG: hypothetical protein ABI629_05455, partial [bacterium]
GEVLALLVFGGIPGPQEQCTPPLINAAPDVRVCVAQNIGTQAVVVAAELRAANGSVSDRVEVPPGRTVEIAHSAAGASGYCAFSFDADPASVRGYIHRRPPGGSTRALFPAFGVRRGVAGPLQASTPPLRSIGADVFGCMLQNLSSVTAEVDTELLDADGTVIDSSTDQMMAGRFGVVRSNGGDHLGAYCRFTVAGNADEVRGYSLLYSGAGDNAHLVFPASPADETGGLTLWSPAVSSLSGDATLCAVQNVDSVPLMVDADIVDSSGSVIDSGSVVVMPDEVETVTGHTEGGTDMVCRFTFHVLGARARAFISRFPSGVFRNTDLLELAMAPGGGAVAGGKTYSPPLRIGSDGFLRCAAVNLSNAAIPVHYEIDDGSGVIVAMVDTPVAAGRGKGALAVSDQTDGFCTFAFAADPLDLRGFATLTNDSGQRTQLVFAAAPAGPSSTATPSPTRTTTPRPTFTATDSPLPTFTATATPSATATATTASSATAVVTDTPASTPTATAAPTGTQSAAPSSTPTAQSTAPPTVPPGGACIGDCDGDGTVTIDELVALVNIGLGAPLAPCAASDRNGDGAIGIDELVVAVNNALNGCPS